jgi:hypothetical protein
MHSSLNDSLLGKHMNSIVCSKGGLCQSLSNLALSGLLGRY